MPTVAEPSPSRRAPSHTPLLIIGVLWLLFGAAVLLYQLARPAQIEIEWITETEFETAGFNIYRATAPDGDFVRLNEALIPSRAEPAAGARYVYIDENIAADTQYFYVLEDVEYSGNLQRHDNEVLAGEFARFEWWALLAIPVPLLVGGVLLFTGLRREHPA